MNKTKILDMTDGKIVPLLIKFSIPLLAGNLFQQLYNIVDSVVVGNFVGKEALAAIGSTNQIINSILGFFMGFATGGSVVVSQFFGGKNIPAMRKAIHTLIFSTVVLGVAFTAFGIALNPTFLSLMDTPHDVFHDANLYLTIYFEGIIFLMVYNIASGILRALGNSRLPFVALVLSSVLNVGLDALFVIVLDFGIAGAGYATIISEAFSAVFVLFFLFRTNEVYKLSLREMRVDFPILKRIVKLGLPGGFQMSLTCFSNVFVQGYINKFGSDCMAGWASFNKIDQVCLLPMQSLSLASTTFAGQNFGAGKLERAEKGILASVLLAMCISFIVMLPTRIFSDELVSLFNSDSGVVYYGTYFVKVCTAFYVIRCGTQIFAGGLRGLGNARAPMVILLCGFVAFRQLYLFVATHITDAFFPVSIAYPVGWTFCSVTMFVYYLHFVRSQKRKSNL